MKSRHCILLIAFAVIVSTAFSQTSLAEQVARYVTADILNVRKAPSIQSDIVGKLPLGSRLKIYGTEGDWARINQPDASSAKWVHGDYLSAKRPDKSISDANCWEELGTWDLAAFGGDEQMAKIQEIVRSGRCKIFAFAWTGKSSKSSSADHYLLYDRGAKSIVRFNIMDVAGDKSLLWERWSFRTSASVLGVDPVNGIDLPAYADGEGPIELSESAKGFVSARASRAIFRTTYQ